MNPARQAAIQLPEIFVRRPLSLATTALALIVIAAALYQRVRGNLYLEGLNWIDAFTPVMIALLLLRAVWRLRRDSDLQAVSLALIAALSFIFSYEALYKILFYLPPKQIAPPEMREFLIHAGTGLTVMAGFAFGRFRVSKTSAVFLVLFVLLYVFWLLAGFPQVDNTENYYRAWIPVPWSWNLIYAVNRSTKVLLFLTYFFFIGRAADEVNTSKRSQGFA